VSWWIVGALCISAYGLKAVGLALAGRVPAQSVSLDVLVVPVIAALILIQTLDGGREIVFDARIPALLVAALLVWRRAPLLVVVLAAGATAAALRLL
jgi:branched chain amino acid efflux pump